MAADAVDLDFGDALEGEVRRPLWQPVPRQIGMTPRRWPWSRPAVCLPVVKRAGSAATPYLEVAEEAGHSH